MNDKQFTMERIESLISNYTARMMSTAHSEGYDEGFKASADEQFDSGYNEALASIEDAGLCYEDGYAAALDENQKSYDKGYADGLASAQVAADITASNQSYDQGFDDGLDAGLAQTSEAGFDHGWDCAIEQMMGLSKP